MSAIEAERAMVDATGASGGFAIPIAIDPTILLTGAGALNPIREIADVRQISSYTLRLVSANTPAANYGAELTEVADGTPTLVQPTVTTAKGMEFIPFSIEIGEDWTGMQQELLKLLTDGQAVLDATMFLTGTGSNQPQGLFSGAGGLQTTQRTQTATTATTVIGDLYSVRQAISSTRFWKNATFAASPTAWDIFYRYVAQASTTDPLPFTQGRGGPFLGTPKVEWSTMSAAHHDHGQQDRHRRRLVRLCDRRSHRRLGGADPAPVRKRQPFSDRSPGPLLLLEDRHGRLQAFRVRVPRSQVVMAGDAPYGDVDYADEGLQADHQKRYPIDTKEHAKAAWAFINEDENAAQYSAKDLALVKGRILAACHKFGIDTSENAATLDGFDHRGGPPRDGLVRAISGCEVRDAPAGDAGPGTLTATWRCSTSGQRSIRSTRAISWSGMAREAFAGTIAETGSRMSVTFNHGKDPAARRQGARHSHGAQPRTLAGSATRCRCLTPRTTATWHRASRPAPMARASGFNVARRRLRQARARRPSTTRRDCPSAPCARLHMPEFGPVTYPAYPGASRGCARSPTGSTPTCRVCRRSQRRAWRSS